MEPGWNAIEAGFSTCKGVAYPVRGLVGVMLERYLYHFKLSKQLTVDFGKFPSTF
jgi:hypothetical protein